MKLMIVGYGKMGHEIETAALARGHQCISVDSGNGQYSSITEAIHENCTAALEFTRPDSALSNVLTLLEKRIPVVCGTTGWDTQLPVAHAAAEKFGTAFIHASNFSVGMYIFSQLVKNVSAMISNMPEYDIFASEIHHRAKKDSPSGTAKTLARTIIENCHRKTEAEYNRIDNEISPDTLHFSSLRGGSIFGTHTIYADSGADTIELTHNAKNRSGFALGAILAAEYIQTRTGVFSIHQVMESVLKP